MRLAKDVLTLGRYALHEEIASGGMATVYFGRLMGPVGFSRVVAVKRMHAWFASDPEFVAMFLDEANLAARVQHPNVVATLDVVAERGEIFIVMEYVRGESLASLVASSRRRRERIPVPIAMSLMTGALAGLHAAHEARGESGDLLGIVHRDVSPQNILVGVDGLARIVDFGIAKATTRLIDESTHDSQVKGKIRYLAPEQLDRGARVDRRSDVFAAGVVLWEILAGRKLYEDSDPALVVSKLLAGEIPPLRRFRTDVSPRIEAVVRRALRRGYDERHATALEFATELEAAAPRIATARAVGEWVTSIAAPVLRRRDALVLRIERAAPGSVIDGDRISTNPDLPDDTTEVMPDRREDLRAGFPPVRALRHRRGRNEDPTEPTKTLVPSSSPPPPDESTSDLRALLIDPPPPADAPAELDLAAEPAALEEDRSLERIGRPGEEMVEEPTTVDVPRPSARWRRVVLAVGAITAPIVVGVVFGALATRSPTQPGLAAIAPPSEAKSAPGVAGVDTGVTAAAIVPSADPRSAAVDATSSAEAAPPDALTEPRPAPTIEAARAAPAPVAARPLRPRPPKPAPRPDASSPASQRPYVADRP